MANVVLHMVYSAHPPAGPRAVKLVLTARVGLSQYVAWAGATALAAACCCRSTSASRAAMW
jgi:hypothetical protein